MIPISSALKAGAFPRGNERGEHVIKKGKLTEVPQQTTKAQHSRKQKITLISIFTPFNSANVQQISVHSSVF